MFIICIWISDYISFINAVCRKYGIKKSRFIEVVNRINKRQIENIYESFLIKAVSGIKVPFLTNDCKIYSRPFKLGNSYVLGEKAVHFLTRLYNCDERNLEAHIRYLWVSSELFSDRVVLTTQYHELVH